MPVTSIYDVFFNGEKWVARLGEELLDRAALLAKIKTKRRADLPVEEEWAAFALIERYATEARWDGSQKQ
jgi:hypothetical protein